MLDVFHLDAGVIVPILQAVPLNPLFQSLNQLLVSRSEGKNLRLRLRANPLWIRMAPHLLQRQLSNLVENAIKYMNKSGVLVLARARDETVWFDLCATRIGIAPDRMAYIFDAFDKVNNPGRDRTRGLEIGLSIVQCLSELVGHPVQVQSRPGPVNQFRVVIDMAVLQDLRCVRDSRVPVLFKPVAAETLLQTLASLRRTT